MSIKNLLTSKQITRLASIAATDVENGHLPPTVIEVLPNGAVVLDTGTVIEPDGRVSREPNV